MSEAQPADLADEDFCYVTTTGRRSRAPHTIEIWFAVADDAVYLLSGGGDRADWVRTCGPTLTSDSGSHSRSGRRALAS